MIRFHVDVPPMSQNQVYKVRGDHKGLYMTEDGQKFKMLIGLLANKAMANHEIFKIPSVYLEFLYDNKRKNDIDGPIKLTLDSMNGIAYKDDSQIQELHVYKGYSKTHPRISITIKENA